MQTRNQKLLLIGILAISVLSLTLFSFSPRPGADHFEIYLNKKLLFQQYVGQTSALKALTLDQRNANDQVDIFYSHCGKLGTKRTVTIKDGKNTIKQWRFADGSGNKFMSVGAKEILAFKNKDTDRKLNLYYSSEELQEARLLASIILDTDDNKAMP